MGGRLFKMKLEPSPNVAKETMYPLDSLHKVVQVFKEELNKGNNADIALLSILAGYVEDYFTTSRVFDNNKISSFGKKPLHKNVGNPKKKNEYVDDLDVPLMPALTKDQLQAMHQKFSSMIRGYCDMSLIPDNISVNGSSKHAAAGSSKNSNTAAVIKRVSDIIWNTLNEDKNKDRTHASNIFCYLTEAKVNCFGLALGVVAGCQVLGYTDVHLAMSEDHAWVVYGPKGEETAEVTWHERIPADRRGEQLDKDHCSQSWLYSGGHPVICNRQMEVAAIVTALNPNFSVSSSSEEIISLQQGLLWLLHDGGHLARYPMALGTLAELQDFSQSKSKVSSEQLYSKAISVSEKLYSNHHVYPYLFSASYYQRSGSHAKALAHWASAAQVLRHYNYSKEDDEIYKDFYDINCEVIPGILKSDKTCCTDSDCFASIIRFCDGLCSWEEGGATPATPATPVLHVGWTKYIIKDIMMFHHSVRSCVKFVPANIHDSASRRKVNDGSIELYSAKMTGLISLLSAEKMNVSALQLQLTAQAQADSRRKSEAGDSTSSRAKRLKKA